MPVAVKWQMLLLSQKEALWLFNLIFFYGCFLCINPQEESFVFLGIWDGPQLHWASLLLTGGNKKAGSCWRFGIFCLFEGMWRRDTG